MSDHDLFRVAALQPALRWRQFIPNMHHLRQRVDALMATNAVDLLVLPESFTAVPAEDGDVSQMVEQARQFLSTLARACRVAVVGGSISRRDESGAIYNTWYVVNRVGEHVGSYDKRQLFNHELATRTPGGTPGVFDVDGIRVGVLICGDLWFPDLARELVDRVDVLCVPAATVVPSERNRDYARASWHRLAFTRAQETGCVVVVSDWADGRHEELRQVGGQEDRHVRWTSGAACITNPAHRPDLERMQKVTRRGEEAHLVAAVDLEKLAAFRSYRQRVGLIPSTEPR